ncbi:MAG TPA: glycosyltransferase family 39 protein [Thermoanaerobaculia bacterium]|nr:glycosyltransferase family 39 protein [Thermoanaerobaculia bacterium]
MSGPDSPGPSGPSDPSAEIAPGATGAPRRPAAARIAGLVLLAAFGGLCAHGLRWDSPTVDEFAHLPAGYYYLKTGNFELYDLNPPLPRVLSALPLLALSPQIDTGARLRDNGWYPWVFATDFMRRNRERFDRIFLFGRLPVVGLGMALALLVWHWARRLYGEEAGLVALAGCAFCPSLIAHAHLATTDVAFALAATAALYLAQRWLERPRLPALLAAGAALGLAQLTKFSAVLLYPVLLLLAVAALVRGERFPLRDRSDVVRDGRHRSHAAELGWSLASLAVLGLVSLAVLDAGYLFQGVGGAVGGYQFRSRLMKVLAAALPRRLPLPLPAPYLHGFDSIQLINEQGEFPTWFCGRWLPQGTWLYYPLTLLLKTPLPLLAAWLAAPFARLPRSPADAGRRRHEEFLWLPVLVLLAVFSLGSKVSYGIRYLLPIVPLACIYSGRLVPWLRTRGRAVRAAALALLLIYPASALLATPDTIAYFNPLAVGGGDRYLLDSNLDWGQGLKRLRAFLDREHLPGIPLAYFGHVDPSIYGIRWRFPDPNHPGPAVVSANFAHGYPYVTNVRGHMVPVPAGAFSWIARHPRRADLGGGLYLYEIGAGMTSDGAGGR